MRRLHTELLVEVSSDLAGENILGKFDEEQDSDNLTHTVGPYDMTLAAGAAATQLTFPGGGTVLRFLSIMKVDNANGVNVHFDGGASDPVLVKPPIGTGLEGQFLATTSATSLYLSNPDSSADVSFSIMMGFAAS